MSEAEPTPTPDVAPARSGEEAPIISTAAKGGPLPYGMTDVEAAREVLRAQGLSLEEWQRLSAAPPAREHGVTQLGKPAL